MENRTPLVSIICLAYNHEKFIQQALDGFVMQQTNFPFEIIVHDDASRDNTVHILKEYEEKFPGLFANIYQKENQYSKPKNEIGAITFGAARGKYIALCDGDDYWTDTNKLQKQVNFLEANPDYAICFHAVNILENDELKPAELNRSDKEETYSIENLGDGNIMHTPSVVFRNGLIDKFPDWFSESAVGDYVIHFLNARKGLIKYFPEVMAVYRRHPNGIWSGQNFKNLLEKYIKVLGFLMSEDFGDAAKERLFLQKRKYVEEYLDLLFQEENSKEFLENLAIFSEADNYISRKWLLEYYPAQIQSLKKHITGLTSTKTFRFSKRLSGLYYSFKKF